MSAPKRATDKMRYGYSISFTQEQSELLRTITLGRGQSFSELVEYALGSYIPTAFGLDWPRAIRLSRPNKKLKTSRIYGVLFTAEQDELLREIIRTFHVRFSELVERALGDYVPVAYGIDWPNAPRLSRTG